MPDLDIRETARRMGRPPSENPRNRKIAVSLTSSESEALAEVSAWLGMSMSEYIRMCVFGETAYHRKKIAEARGKGYR